MTEVRFTNYKIENKIFSAEGWIYSSGALPKSARLIFKGPSQIIYQSTEVILGDSYKVSDNIRPQIKNKTAFYFFGSLAFEELKIVLLEVVLGDSDVFNLDLPLTKTQLRTFVAKNSIKKFFENVGSVLWMKQQLEILVKSNSRTSVQSAKKLDSSQIDDLLFLSNGPLSLIIDHALGGGANYFREVQIAQRINNGEQVVILTYDLHKLKYILTINFSNEPSRLLSTKDFGLIQKFIQRNKFTEIYINNLVSFPKPQSILSEISKVRKLREQRIVVAVHDFFMVCPSFNLLDNNGSYCGIPDLAICNKCLPLLTSPMINLARVSNIDDWRSLWGQIFELRAEIHCFSQAALDIFGKCFPKYLSQVLLIPHQLPKLRSVNLKPKKKVDVIHIGVVGNISFNKGEAIINDLVNLISCERLAIKIIVIGSIKGNFESDVLVQTGPYQVLDLPSLMEQFEIDFVFMPSIWPETFSYVCHEIRAINMPLVTFDLGAQLDVTKNYEHGYSLSISSPKVMLNQLIQIYQLHIQKLKVNDSRIY
jgi:glycosyltransferase involved in cell wall biosynthesis